jgi:hypothetical protein
VPARPSPRPTDWITGLIIGSVIQAFKESGRGVEQAHRHV